MKPTMHRLSIVIPVYNEEKAIINTLAFFRGLLDVHPEIEVILADDGSTDRTKQILKEKRDPRMKLVTHIMNIGYGAAIKSGAQVANGDYIAITDADGSYPNERIMELYERMIEEKVDMIVGARTGRIIKMGIIRRFPKFFLRKLAEYLSESKIPDLNSGLRIIRRNLFQKSAKYLPDGFSLTTTLTLFSHPMATRSFMFRSIIIKDWANQK